MSFSSAPSSPLKPFLKWVGGKRWLVPLLAQFWQRHAHRRLVEPFAGGLSVALGLRPRRALLNDANVHLINLYQQVQCGFSVTSDWQSTQQFYNHQRADFNRFIATGDSRTQHTAQLFYYLNRTGFNGLTRFNQSGVFNVPFGKRATVSFVRDFSPYTTALRSWHFSAFDVANLKPFVSSNDFIYADPPYDVPFTQYTPAGFSWGDQVRLAHWLVRHRGPVIVSNQATPRIINLYMRLGFTLRFLTAPRRIHPFGDRTPAREILALRSLGRE